MCELTKGGISQLTSRKSATPVHLIELSIRDMKKMKDNSIIVTSIQRNNGKYNEISTCYYKTVEYGNNIQIERSSIIGVDGKAIEYEDILLSKIKGNYILILALKSEILDSDNNTVIIQNSFNQSDHIKPSGYVLLVYAILDKNNPTKVIWENEHVQICHDSKPNTISDKNQHFGSSGYIYTFGNRANYGMINGSSITQYVTKKYSNETKTNKAKSEAEKIEIMCGNEIDHAIHCFKRRFRNIHLLISPVIDAADTYQKLIGDVNLKTMSTSENGIWQFSVCVNSTTALCHTERDCTYTVITVPMQHAQKKIKSKKLPKFCFNLNENKNVRILYEYQLSFVFSGYYITHHQIPPVNSFHQDYPFINMSSYGNQKLFNHMRASIIRKLNNH